jgi:hypothetical protein
MSILELSAYFGRYPFVIIGIFTIMPLFAFLYGRLHDRNLGIQAPHKYIYAGLVYMTSIPGAFATTITIYTLFFLSSNLLAVDILIYFLPIVSMAITLIVINSRVKLDLLPGFGRISALFILLFVSFLLALVIQRTYIILMFRGSIFVYFALVVVLFFLLRYAGQKLFAMKK